MKKTTNKKIALATITISSLCFCGGAISWWGGFKEEFGYNKAIMEYPPKNNEEENNKENEDKFGKVEGSINNNEYENYFDDNDWKTSNQWQKDNKILTCEPSPITERDGGPKMTNINYFATNNFRMKVEFVPKSSSDEINFVIYIGGFYRMVLGDGNRKFFYIKQGDNFISETNKSFKRPIELENEIRFDKPIEIEIIQSVLSNTNVASVDVVIKYFPEENHNAEQTRENFHFQINNDSFHNNEEKIILGLLCEKNTVTAKLNYFYLKNN